MSASKRVAHVSTVHHPLDPRIYRKEIGTLRKRSIDTWLIARGANGGPQDERFLRLNDRSGVLARLRRHAEAWRHLRKLRPAVIHIHDPELIPLAGMAKARLGCRVIYDMHEDYAGRNRKGGRLLRFLERRAFKWVDHVILAEASYDEILRGFAVPSTAVLNYMLPPQNGTPPRRDSPLTLVYAGTLSNCRGLSNMLDLAAEIRSANLPWKIRIAGVCHLADERRAAEERIRAEKLDSVVEAVGWDHYLSWDDLMDQLVDADIGLALFEPLQNHTRSILSKFYEYIYFNLPVVASDFPLWRSFFEANGTGVVVDAGDAAGVLSAIRRVTDTTEYERLVEAARSARNDYLWSRMEPRLLETYEGLLEESEPSVVGSRS